MRVVIDGVEYAPACKRSSNIGIAITTHDRNDILAKTLEQHKRHLPSGAFVAVIDDGSSDPVSVPDWVHLVRHEKSKGIVASKNASLRVLIDAGCTELFLWDDDAYPIADGWHEPYIDSPEPHLAYQFLDLIGPTKLNDICVMHADKRHVAYSGQRGVMLYYNKAAIDAVGGFDWIYGRGMYEHSDLAIRIHHAGLTTRPFADVAGSNKLIYSLDEHNAVKRSVPKADREALVRKNAAVHNERRDSGYTAYVDFREKRNVALTFLLTAAVDPQRGTKMKPSASLLEAWSASVTGADRIVLADELSEAPKGADIVRVEGLDSNPYFLRWMHIYQWLRDNKDVGLAWCTDGTDVVMLREPWGDMDPDKLYVGSEPKTLADEWIIKNHDAPHLREFVKANAAKPMLNAGLIGGTRETVMKFAHDIVSDTHWLGARRFWKAVPHGREIGDMATFNYVAYTKWADRIVTGPQVHTVFRSNGTGKEYAWWQHK